MLDYFPFCIPSFQLIYDSDRSTCSTQFLRSQNLHLWMCINLSLNNACWLDCNRFWLECTCALEYGLQTKQTWNVSCVCSNASKSLWAYWQNSTHHYGNQLGIFAIYYIIKSSIVNSVTTQMVDWRMLRTESASDSTNVHNTQFMWNIVLII